MTEVRKPRKPARKPEAREVDERVATFSDDLRDTWLGKQLDSLYGPIVDEPLPEYMLQLIGSRKH